MIHYGGDSYVVLYTYLKNKKPEHIIYFWLGRTSSTDEIGTYAQKYTEWVWQMKYVHHVHRHA